jgi:RNA polymerase sigma-70 factor (ECF subfamily)
VGPAPTRFFAGDRLFLMLIAGSPAEVKRFARLSAATVFSGNFFSADDPNRARFPHQGTAALICSLRGKGLMSQYSEDACDRALLAGAVGADCRAFAELYRRYAARVHVYVHNIVGDPAVAEELVVDTMTAVWRGARTYRASARVSTWILGIARHKALDAARSRVRARASVRLDASMPLPASTATPLECASDAQRDRIMRRAFARLSSEHQQTLHLVFYQ